MKLSSFNPIAGGISVQATAPSNPTTDQLWIDTTAGQQQSFNNGLIDLSYNTSDYLLQVGETAIVNYIGTTSVPLHVKTEEGEYEVLILGERTTTQTFYNNLAQLNPNNAIYTNSIDTLMTYTDITIGGATSPIGPTGYKYLSGFFGVALALVVKSTLKVTTITKNKTINGACESVYDTGSGNYPHRMASVYSSWNDTTTPWVSLGTIIFPFVQSGKIAIRRII